MKDGARATSKAIQNKMSVPRSPKQQRKIQKNQVTERNKQKSMFKIEGDGDQSLNILDEQYRKTIGITDRDMNSRTFSGPIVYQMKTDMEA